MSCFGFYHLDESQEIVNRYLCVPGLIIHCHEYDDAQRVAECLKYIWGKTCYIGTLSHEETGCNPISAHLNVSIIETILLAEQVITSEDDDELEGTDLDGFAPRRGPYDHPLMYQDRLN